MIARLSLAALFICGAVTGASAAGVSDSAQSAPPPGLTPIFSNLGTKYPNGDYFCCEGFVVQGPNNPYNDREVWRAVQFTPGADYLVKRISVGVTSSAGTNSVVVGLYTDSAGVPGSAIKTWNVTNVPPDNSCCALVTAKDNAGVPVTGGVPYWVVVKTDAFDTASVFAWVYNTTDQIDPLPQAEYCSADVAGDCGSNNDVWTAADGGYAPGFAVGVFGN